MAKITTNNFLAGAITLNKLDTPIQNDINNANTANAAAATAATIAAATFNSANTVASSLTVLPPIISTITITDSSWNALDDTAANTGGGYCVITGSGFNSNTSVIFGTTSATAVTYVSATTLRVQIPALAATSYPVYVINNSNGATAIKPNALTISSSPIWGTAATLANVSSNTVFSTTLSANSDSSVTYANTTVLPTGTTLAANGYFSGNVSVGADTTYSFDVKATDAELQDQTRTFSLTVTTAPPVPSYRYFRVVLNSVNGGGSQAQITELSFRNSSASIITQSITSYSGAIQATNGTPIQNMTNDAASNLEHSNFSALPFTFIYDMTTAQTLGTNVKYLQIGSSDDTARYPNSITVSGSNDGSNWTQIISGAPPSYSGVNVRQNWTIY